MQKNLHILSHPFAKGLLQQLRDRTLPRQAFHACILQLSTLLLCKATTTDGSPDADARLILVPILCSGQSMLEAALSLFPDSTAIYHLGLFRDPATLQPIEYYNKLPRTLRDERYLILDPLLATGGTMIAAIEAILACGAIQTQITVVSIAGTREGIQAVLNRYPNVRLCVAAGDEDRLSENGKASPGFGDIGDRLYGSYATLHEGKQEGLGKD